MSGGRRSTTAYRVARAADLPPGARAIVDVGGRSIGVFNVGGTYHAVRNLCPHQQAPLCEGPVMDTTLPSAPGAYVFGLEGRVLRCPWHGWEFDLVTGRSLFDPHACRVRSYPVTVEDHAPTLERFEVTLEGPFVVVHA